MTLETPRPIMEGYAEQSEEATDSIAGWPRWQRDNRPNPPTLKESSGPTGPEGISRSKERLSLMLYNVGALKFEPSKSTIHEIYPDAPPSPINLDLTLLQTSFRERQAALRIYQELLEDLDFNLIAATGSAIPLASLLSEREGEGIVIPKGRGVIEGLRSVHSGKRVLLVEGSLSIAKSSIESAAILRSHDLEVSDLVTLVDEGYKRKSYLLNQGIRLHSAMSVPQMTDFYLRRGVINQQTHEEYKKGYNALFKYITSN